MLAIDVVICTRNRASWLAETLQAIVPVVTGWPSARLLLVDNGSTDETPLLAASLAAENARVVSLHEARPGLYHARACAIGYLLDNGLPGDILLFVDDDVTVPADLLSRVQAVFADPAIGAAGGGINGLYEGELPEWVAPGFLPDLGLLPLAAGEVIDCRYPCYPPGTCLALRQDPCLRQWLAPARAETALGWGGGAAGVVVTGGDDTDLCEIYARAGYRIVRDGRIQVGHRLVPAKMSPYWVMRKAASDGHLRVRLARLRGRPAVCRETVRYLAAWPLLEVIALLLPLARGLRAGASGRLPEQRVLQWQFYRAKARGAWRELLAGERKRRFPYPSPSPGPG